MKAEELAGGGYQLGSYAPPVPLLLWPVCGLPCVQGTCGEWACASPNLPVGCGSSWEPLGLSVWVAASHSWIKPCLIYSA